MQKDHVTLCSKCGGIMKMDSQSSWKCIMCGTVTSEMSSIIAKSAGQESSGRAQDCDFITFKVRIMRLVKSLIALRDVPQQTAFFMTDEQEGVDVKLQSDNVAVQLIVAFLPWEILQKLVSSFLDSFGKHAFVESFGFRNFTLKKAIEKAGGYGIYIREQTSLCFSQNLLGGNYSVTIATSMSDFNDHFEDFVTNTAKTLFPPIEKPKKKPTAGLESWYKEYGSMFQKLGCRVSHDTSLGWKDLVGLDSLRERLERTIFVPLAREPLYQKIAERVMTPRARLLPRGVFLSGPPGCGKTWSMKVIASEAKLPVVILPCEAVLSKWFGESENRLASVFRLCREVGRMILMIDELDALARHRSDSHEVTARMVTILLTELDGLVESSEVLIVGAANNVELIDKAVLDRFDTKIQFEIPTRTQLLAALVYYAKQLSSEDHAEIVEKLDGWNFRRLAKFAEQVIRAYVSQLNLNLLEASEPPLPRKEDYLAVLSEEK